MINSNKFFSFIVRILSKHSGQSDDDFVEMVYQAVLKRPVDPNGLKHYKTMLGQGATRLQVIEHCRASDEFKRINQQAVQHDKNKLLFEVVYGRRPAPDEMNNINGSGVDPDKPMTTNMRLLIGNHDRSNYHTPVTVRFGKEDLFECQVDDRSMVLDAADSSVSAMIRNAPNGHYEPHMTKLFKGLIKSGMKVADVGANVGYFTLLFSECVGAEGHVYAFDPNSENCRLLMLNILRNNVNNVTIYPFGLSNKVGSSFFSPCIGSNGTILLDDSETIFNKNCIVIPTMTLDHIIDTNIDFIKMDTEGAEGLIVAGAQSVIRKCRPIVSSEFSMEMLPRVSQMGGTSYFDMFTSLSYKVFMVNKEAKKPLLTAIPEPRIFLDNYGDPCRIEDLLFVPEEKMECIEKIES